ncbi:Uncharacterized protein Adt_11908 [Abeliophyllum distichum]|uniref:Uncharacterized protein n=1 Tax=Abeliophyllum distichum TaxID=126358 RepID=A0ABD1UP78_9LAMI
MNATVFHGFCPSFVIPTIKQHPSIVFVSLPVQNQQGNLRSKGFKLKCSGKGDSVSELEKKLEEELMGMGRLNEKCRGASGIVELMECLEREALMGEDEGKEPTDYNRRAHIFDKSSRVFQALKETNSTVS